MTPHSLVSLWRIPLLSALIGAILALAFSFVLPFRYSSTVRVLITQPTATGLDPYTAIKTREIIAASLRELVYTSSFFSNTMAQVPGFDATYFPQDERAKRKAWQRAIEMEISAGSGIMSIAAFHTDRGQARVLAEAVAREMALEAPNFFGTTVRAQVIDSPLESSWIAKPDFFSNGVMGLVIGLFIGVIWSFARLNYRPSRSSS